MLINRIILFAGIFLITVPSALAQPVVLKTFSEKVEQVVIVEEIKRFGFRARLSAWERQAEGWAPVFTELPAVVGRNGIIAPRFKEEGDSRTPSGIYPLKRAFGYHKEEEVETGLLYAQVTDLDYWVDDPLAKLYNQWVRGIPKVKSFELLKRTDDLYKYAVVIEYNTEKVVPGKGSAIFLHVWRSENSATAGCVAMAEQDVVSLMRWLDRERHPRIVIGKD